MHATPPHSLRRGDTFFCTGFIKNPAAPIDFAGVTAQATIHLDNQVKTPIHVFEQLVLDPDTGSFYLEAAKSDTHFFPAGVAYVEVRFTWPDGFSISCSPAKFVIY